MFLGVLIFTLIELKAVVAQGLPRLELGFLKGGGLKY